MTKENKREMILNALETLLPGRRFHEITLDEVARTAQVGKGTIYLYFSDKDALFAELVVFQMERLCDGLSMLATADKSQIPEQIFALVSQFISSHQNYFGAVGEAASQIARLNQQQHSKLREQARKIVDTITGIMARMNNSWSESDARDYARLLLWLIDGYCRTLNADPAVRLPEPAMLLNFFRQGAALPLNGSK